MLINDIPYHTIWLDDKGRIKTFDQRYLPFKIKIITLRTSDDVYSAIREMKLRGAPAIGVAAAYGMYLACKESKSASAPGKYILKKYKQLLSARPTAVNLQFALKNSLEEINNHDDKISAALEYANKLKAYEIDACKKIGEYGVKLIENIYKKKKSTVNILTHCNAGWLACIEYGTATAPIYFAAAKKIPVHVWVEETRPRNQGASITAFELYHNHIPHTIICDNAGGYVLQKKMADIVITGSDRTTANGDVCNKIGTYKTALAAFDNGVPFYAAVPSSSFDLSIDNGLSEIPIEERTPDEVDYISGLYKNKLVKVRITPPHSMSKNFGFDITPAKLVTGLITDKGIISPVRKENIKAIILSEFISQMRS
ncbi:MAG TPA: S-methyl-5-thioribose-1-phosphate isomerase [Ignavibacteria bacterium]|nr:S-methyl-5-thioribose-1-phosphate isomerase [Ignavibacteria bacterium]